MKKQNKNYISIKDVKEMSRDERNKLPYFYKKYVEEINEEEDFLKMLDDIKNGISFEEFELKYRKHK